MNECDMPKVIHSPDPNGRFTAFMERGTVLVIGKCICGEDCAMTASVMPEGFFTPQGEQGERVK
jgi:hypothetical protein